MIAGHDFASWNRITTVSLAVQYLGIDHSHDALAFACCTCRGRQISHADATVRSDSGRDLVHGLVTAMVSGVRTLDEEA